MSNMVYTSVEGIGLIFLFVACIQHWLCCREYDTILKLSCTWQQNDTVNITYIEDPEENTEKEVMEGNGNQETQLLFM